MSEEKQIPEGIKVLADLILSNHTADEILIGYLRYQAVRHLPPKTFHDIGLLELNPNEIDGLLDRGLKSWKPEDGKPFNNP